MKLLRYVSGFALTVFLSGCFFISTFQGPEVLDKGEQVVQLGMSGLGSLGNGGGVSVPVFPELTYRKGLGGYVDMGARLGIGMVGADVKYQFLHGPLMAAAGVGGSVFGSLSGSDESAVLGVYPAFFVGGRRFYAGYRYIWLTGTADVWGSDATFSGGVSSVLLGATFGERWQFIPEVSVFLPTNGEGETFFSYGIGIRYRWGGQR